jgi:hypothetical protein
MMQVSLVAITFGSAELMSLAASRTALIGGCIQEARRFYIVGFPQSWIRRRQVVDQSAWFILAHKSGRG